jgi:malonyl-CoA O-methyltransferase
MTIDARAVVDLGSATGTGSRLLERRFRRARIVAVDLSRNMLEAARRKQSRFTRRSSVQANAQALPFANHSIDVIFANLLLPWVSDPALLFTEVSRVLRKDGLFLFSTLGPDSLSAIRNAWASVDTREHVNRFLDMHDIGDAAVRAGLHDPVLDVDRLSVTYNDARTLFRDLTEMGARNCLQGRERSLGGTARFRAMMAALDGQREDKLLTLDLELVYGHCWGSGPPSADGEYRFDAKRIGHRRT